MSAGDDPYERTLFRLLDELDDGTFWGEREAVQRFADWCADLRAEAEREGQ